MTDLDKSTDLQAAEYRQTLGTYATGVTVVTAALDSGEMVGTTVNSFTSVSLHPPLILWCLAAGSDNLDTYSQAGYFAVNILASDQVKTSIHFARKQKNKFKSVRFKRGKSGAPLLSDCVAWLQCRKVKQYDIGDHRVFVGEVEKFECNHKEPLLYHHGNYSISIPSPETGSIDGGITEHDADTDDSLYALLLNAIHTYQENFENRQHQFIDNNYEARILVLLHGRKKVKVSTLAQKLQLPAPETVGLVDDLQTHGLVRLSRSAEDDYVILTVSGKEKSGSLRELAKQHEKEAMSLFKKGEAQLFRKSLLRLVNWKD